jgi:hypothetical protein
VVTSAFASGQDDGVRNRSQRRQILLLLAIVLFVAVPSVGYWQLALLGAGFVTIGLVLLVQGRRRSAR